MIQTKEADDLVIGEENLHLGSTATNNNPDYRRITSPSSGSRTNSMSRAMVADMRLMPAIKEDEREYVHRTLIEASVNETDTMPSRDLESSLIHQ